MPKKLYTSVPPRYEVCLHIRIKLQFLFHAHSLQGIENEILFGKGEGAYPFSSLVVRIAPKLALQHRGERRILVGIHVFLKISESPSIPHGSTVAIEWTASVLLAHLRINNVQERLL